MVVDDEEKANILNTFFSTVFTVENEMLGEIPRNNENPILRVTNLTQEEVRNRLNKIKIDKSPGPDGIHPRVLRELTTGSVPQDWRIANVVPIFKKGSKSEPGNYRPHFAILPIYNIEKDPFKVDRSIKKKARGRSDDGGEGRSPDTDDGGDGRSPDTDDGGDGWSQDTHDGGDGRSPDTDDGGDGQSPDTDDEGDGRSPNTDDGGDGQSPDTDDGGDGRSPNTDDGGNGQSPDTDDGGNGRSPNTDDGGNGRSPDTDDGGNGQSPDTDDGGDGRSPDTDDGDLHVTISKANVPSPKSSVTISSDYILNSFATILQSACYITGHCRSPWC
ncbi:unnamed protein product [Ranitomeya imitator]|uniref:Uncharacterized protein n=1 Tax=Ranitomeya imitator TaxID=111125 RepID=A0ABN9M8Z5_9NEOB|nr:unnamed protein product [Ranitomeya imitator]